MKKVFLKYTLFITVFFLGLLGPKASTLQHTSVKNTVNSFLFHISNDLSEQGAVAQYSEDTSHSSKDKKEFEEKVTEEEFEENQIDDDDPKESLQFSIFLHSFLLSHLDFTSFSSIINGEDFFRNSTPHLPLYVTNCVYRI